MFWKYKLLKKCLSNWRSLSEIRVFHCSFDTLSYFYGKLVSLVCRWYFFWGFHYLVDHYCFITNSVGIWRFLSPYTFPSLGDFFGSYQNLLLLTKVEHMVAFFPSSLFLHAWKFQCMIEKQWKVVRFHFNIFFNCTADGRRAPFPFKRFLPQAIKIPSSKTSFSISGKCIAFVKAVFPTFFILRDGYLIMFEKLPLYEN